MKKLLLLIILSMSSVCFGGSLVCTGTVETVAYHGNNRLMVKLSSMNTPVFFCNPTGTWTAQGTTGRSMGAETCRAVFSMFLSARATKERLSSVHFDGDNVPENCNSFGRWKDVFIRFVSY